MFDHDVLVLDERGPGILLTGGSMVISISNYMDRSRDPEALERQVRGWTRSMNQAPTDFADATPLAGRPKLGEFLRPRATMPSHRCPRPVRHQRLLSRLPSGLPSRLIRQLHPRASRHLPSYLIRQLHPRASRHLPSRLIKQLHPRASRHILDWRNFYDRSSHQGPPQRSAKKKKKKNS